jgi:hypothetical protein
MKYLLLRHNIYRDPTMPISKDGKLFLAFVRFNP